MALSSRRLLLVFLLPALAVVAGTLAMLAAFEERTRAASATLRSTRIIGDVQQVLKLGVDAETGERGYVITESEESLEPFENAWASSMAPPRSSRS